MGVSTTHPINLSMSIYSFSDIYYVWAACVLVRFSFLKLRQKRNKIMFVKQNRPEAKTKEQNQERVAESNFILYLQFRYPPHQEYLHEKIRMVK